MSSGEDFTWFVLDVNPEPWAIGPLSVGRSKGGKVFPQVGRNSQLHAYKEAIKEELGNPDVWFEGPIELIFIFVRRQDAYTTQQARVHRKHEADTTNLQKATEDALQGILFKNDKDVKVVKSILHEQGPDVTGFVVVGIRNSEPKPWFDGVPVAVMDEIDEIRNPMGSDDNRWTG